MMKRFIRDTEYNGWSASPMGHSWNVLGLGTVGPSWVQRSLTRAGHLSPCPSLQSSSCPREEQGQ